MTVNPNERIIEKLQAGVPNGVAVAFVRPITANDQDGETWRMLIGDGDRLDEIDVSLSASSRAEVEGEIDAERIERAVERRSGGFGRETRFDDLKDADLAYGPKTSLKAWGP